MQHSHSAVQWVARTAMGIALIILAQLLGKAFPAGAVIVGPFSVNQLVTGSLVNCVLFVFTATGGLWSGVTMGIVSAMLAQFIGIGPAVSAVSPVVALGNALLCVVLRADARTRSASTARASGPRWSSPRLSNAPSSGLPCRCCSASLSGVKPQQVQMLSIMFSWPQGCTALIGGGARKPRDSAALEAPQVKKCPAGLRRGFFCARNRRLRA